VRAVTPAEERFEAIAITHGQVILAYLARRTAPDQDAADVYQEVLTTAWRKIHVVPDDLDHARAWLLMVARRALSNHRRSHTRRLAATDRLSAELATSALAYGESSPAVDAVRDGLASLEHDDREILTLTYWDGLPAEQVAVVFGISAAAARKRLQRARDRLTVRITRAKEPDDAARAGVVELASPRGGA
jgi:RNA polymerase sigma factor (sigma-70 family)